MAASSWTPQSWATKPIRQVPTYPDQAALVGLGVPFPIALACAMGMSAAVGVLVGLPALRVKGLYLGISTMAFGFIVAEVFARWESVTGGNSGMHVKAPAIGGWALDSGVEFYFLCLVLAVGSTLAILNQLRSPTGRAGRPSSQPPHPARGALIIPANAFICPISTLVGHGPRGAASRCCWKTSRTMSASTACRGRFMTR